MKKLFPNIETAIIAVFVICIMLWGVSKCNKKKDDLAIKTAVENPTMTLPQDSITSPAARRPAAQALPPLAPPTTPDNTSQVAVPAPAPLPMPGSNQPVAVPQPTPPQPVATVPVPLPGTKPKPSPVTSATTPATPASGTMLYVLINGLNVRTKPELKAKSLGKLKLNDQVYFLNEVTGGTQTVRLQDKTEVTKPWFKIKTKRGTVGWVHGSGVDFYKRKPQDGL
jgi:hypothetical protein